MVLWDEASRRNSRITRVDARVPPRVFSVKSVKSVRNLPDNEGRNSFSTRKDRTQVVVRSIPYSLRVYRYLGLEGGDRSNKNAPLAQRNTRYKSQVLTYYILNASE
jgi:hypothetical protein